MKKNIKTKLLASVMAVAMAGSLCACGGGGYMTPVDNWMNAVNKKETDPLTLMTIMVPDFAAGELESVYKSMMKMNDDVADSYEDEIENMEEVYEELEDEFGKYKITFEEKKAEKLEEDDLEEYADTVEDYYDDRIEDSVDLMEETLDDDELLEEMADEADIKESEAKNLIKGMIKYMKTYEDAKVTAGYEVKGKFILKSGKDTYETETVEFIVLKINGSWVYWGLKDWDYYSTLQFEDDDDDLFEFFFDQLYYSSFYESVGF